MEGHVDVNFKWDHPTNLKARSLNQRTLPLDRLKLLYCFAMYGRTASRQLPKAICPEKLKTQVTYILIILNSLLEAFFFACEVKYTVSDWKLNVKEDSSMGLMAIQWSSSKEVHGTPTHK